MNFEITPHETKNRLSSIRLVDVREPSEFAAARIPGAVNIPLGQLAARAAELDGHEEIVMMCRSGARSQMACQIVYAARKKRAYNLTGGIIAWASAGLEVEAGAA